MARYRNVAGADQARGDPRVLAGSPARDRARPRRPESRSSRASPARRPSGCSAARSHRRSSHREPRTTEPGGASAARLFVFRRATRRPARPRLGGGNPGEPSSLASASAERQVPLEEPVPSPCRCPLELEWRRHATSDPRGLGRGGAHRCAGGTRRIRTGGRSRTADATGSAGGSGEAPQRLPNGRFIPAPSAGYEQTVHELLGTVARPAPATGVAAPDDQTYGCPNVFKAQGGSRTT